MRTFWRTAIGFCAGTLVPGTLNAAVAGEWWTVAACALAMGGVLMNLMVDPAAAAHAARDTYLRQLAWDMRRHQDIQVRAMSFRLGAQLGMDLPTYGKAGMPDEVPKP